MSDEDVLTGAVTSQSRFQSHIHNFDCRAIYDRVRYVILLYAIECSDIKKCLEGLAVAVVYRE
jgi:hypothetical protein